MPTQRRHVLDDVARAHPFVLTPGGRHGNAGYVDPPAFLAGPRPVAPLPIQHTAPLVVLTDPQPATARRAVLDLGKTDLPAAEIDDLVLAVSEIVDNALRHRRPDRRPRPVDRAPDLQPGGPVPRRNGLHRTAHGGRPPAGGLSA
jgi:hypothetical protein